MIYKPGHLTKGVLQKASITSPLIKTGHVNAFGMYVPFFNPLRRHSLFHPSTSPNPPTRTPAFYIPDNERAIKKQTSPAS